MKKIFTRPGDESGFVPLRPGRGEQLFFNKGIVGMKAQSVFLTGNGLVIDSKFIL